MALLWLCYRMHGVCGFSAPTCMGCLVWERKMGSLHWYLIPQIPWLGVSKDIPCAQQESEGRHSWLHHLLMCRGSHALHLLWMSWTPCAFLHSRSSLMLPHQAVAALLHMVCVGSVDALCELKWFLQLCKQEWSPWWIPDLSTRGRLSLPPARMSNKDPAGFSTLRKHWRTAVLHNKGGLHV